MYILSKKRSEIMNIDISGRVFVMGELVCYGRSDEKPLCLGEYESGEQARMALRMLFESLKNQRNTAFEMPLEKDVRARVANFGPDIERHHATGKKTKGHGGS